MSRRMAGYGSSGRGMGDWGTGGSDTECPKTILKLDGGVNGGPTTLESGDVVMTVSVKDYSHKHSIEDIDDLQDILDSNTGELEQVEDFERNDEEEADHWSLKKIWRVLQLWFDRTEFRKKFTFTSNSMTFTHDTSIGEDEFANTSDDLMISSGGRYEKNSGGNVIFVKNSYLKKLLDRNVLVGRDITGNQLDNTVGIGSYLNVQGSSNVVIGKRITTNTSTVGSVIIGEDASSFGSASVVIGRGARTTNESNAVVIGSAGSYGTENGISIGKSAQTSSGSNSIAIGTQAQTYGKNCISFGIKNYSYGNNNIAIGTDSRAYDIESSVTEYNSNTSSVAIGKNTEAHGKSIAIGSNLFTESRPVQDDVPDADSFRRSSINIGSDNSYVNLGSIGIGSRNEVYSSDGVTVSNYLSVQDFEGIAIGYKNYSNGAVTIGTSNGATGDTSVLGSYNYAYDSNETVLGTRNYAPDNNMTGVLGYNNTVMNSNNSTILGNGITAHFPNRTYLGNYKSNPVSIQPALQRADSRDMADVEPATLGLDFINSLKPVKYKVDARDAYIATGYGKEKDSTFNELDRAVVDGSKKLSEVRHGFIGQDVKTLVDTLGEDFDGVEVKAGDDGEVSLAYTELIPPMVKAIQELDAKVGAGSSKYNQERLFGRYATSNWTTYPMVDGLSCRSIVWSDELEIFVVVGRGTKGAAIATSSDGVNWTAREVDRAPAASLWNSVTWSPELGMFAACSDSNAYNLMTSFDGVVWTTQEYPIKLPRPHYITWISALGMFVISDGNPDAKTHLFTSVDGFNWEERTYTGGTAGYTEFTSGSWSPELGIFVALSSASANFVTTNDGITWTKYKPMLGGNGRLSRIKWVSELGLFVATGHMNSYKAMVSRDGINWDSVVDTFGGTAQNYNLEWSPEYGLLVAVGQGNAFDILVSSDGYNWTRKVVSGSGNNLWTSVAWSSKLGMFVAVSSQGDKRVMTSLLLG